MRSLGQFQTFFFYEKILHAQKAQKAQISQKAHRGNQAKAQKAQKAQKTQNVQKAQNGNKLISDFLPLRFYSSTLKRCLFCFCSLVCALCFLCV